MHLDRQMIYLLAGIGGLLLLASGITAVLKLRATGAPNPVIANLSARVIRSRRERQLGWG